MVHNSKLVEELVSRASCLLRNEGISTSGTLDETLVGDQTTAVRVGPVWICSHPENGLIIEVVDEPVRVLAFWRYSDGTLRRYDSGAVEHVMTHLRRHMILDDLCA